ncbi:hypothetical protein D3C87_1899290 [compost metagenome]
MRDPSASVAGCLDAVPVEGCGAVAVLALAGPGDAICTGCPSRDFAAVAPAGHVRVRFSVIVRPLGMVQATWAFAARHTAANPSATTILMRQMFGS